MDYSNAVREIWSHQELGGGARDSPSLVRYATLAASSHNTQPWKFKVEPGRIVILPDLSRRCPVVDPDDHHLYASLGCAAENLLVAAAAAGLRGRPSYDPSRSGVRVDLEETTPSRSPLFQAIPNRQCSRAEYDGRDVAAEHLRLLEVAGQGPGISLSLLTTSKQREQVAEYVAEGNTAQFGDPRWAEEMRSWIRFNGREAVATGDGLYGRALGIPDVPRWLGSVLMRLTVSAARQNQKDLRHIRSSAAIAVFFSDADDTRHWIEAGRSYERLALQAAALDLRTAFIARPEKPRKSRPAGSAAPAGRVAVGRIDGRLRTSSWPAPWCLASVCQDHSRRAGRRNLGNCRGSHRWLRSRRRLDRKTWAPPWRKPHTLTTRFRFPRFFVLVDIQDPATESLALGREAAALIVGQPEAPPLQLFLEDAVLLHQVLDDLLLVAVDPSGAGHKQQPQGGEVGRHRSILPCPIPAPVPGPGSAEYSDTTGSFLVPSRMPGVSRVVQVPHHEVANAVGAAIAQVSGELDQVFQNMTREAAIDEARRLAEECAVKAGARRASLKVVEVEDIPLAYLPGNSLRTRVRVVGDIGAG
jgi:hypothetical protein